MATALDEVLLIVWRQSLVENLKIVAIAEQTFRVRMTPRQNLKQVDFVFDGRDLRGLQQNPKTKSRWAAMARDGAKVMQFLEHGKYIAVIADATVQFYSGKDELSTE